MTSYINEYLRNSLGADIIEEHGDHLIFLGYFRGGRQEEGLANCMIKRIEISGQENVKTTTITYAGGCNFDYRYNWADRSRLDYLFASVR